MKKQNLWRIYNIYTGKSQNFYLQERSSRFRFANLNLIKTGLTVLISVLIIFTVVKAGTITPPSGTPEAQFYTLSEIYTRLTTNATSTEGGHSFTFADSLAGTGRTLTEIYNAIPTINPTKLLSDTTYLGVTGTIVTRTLSADSETLNVGYYAATALSAVDSDLAAGNIRKNTAIFGLTGTFYGDTDSAKVCSNASAAGTLTIDASKILSDTTYCGTTGTIVDNGEFSLSCGVDNQSVTAGYYSGGTLAGDADLVAGNISNGVNIFGVIGNLIAGYLFGDSDASKVLTSATGNDGNNSYLAANLDENKVKKGISFGVGPIVGLLFGDTDASKVLTTADGGGAAKGTYNASNLSTTTVKKGTTFGVSETGVYSGYPGSGANRAGLTQATCAAASASGWYWFEDANGDGDSANPDDPEDGICVLAKAQTTVGSWNGYDSTTNPDSTYIADYTCDGVSFPNGSVATYSGIDSAGNPDTTWNQGDCALCQADCYDGVKDLPGNGGYKSAPGDGGATTDYNGPLTPKVLAEWKGTRLPTSADFFGFCGRKDGVPSPYNSPYDYENTTSGDSSSNTYGNYGVQVGRTDEFLDLANTNWEWLSEQHYNTNARIAGNYACSYFTNVGVNNGYRFRAVFRP